MDGLAIVPQPKGAGGFLELSNRTRSAKGRVFEKEILKFGPLLHPKAPGGRVNIDDDFASTLVANFDAGVCDIVQVPLANQKNQHSEDPRDNIGEVIGLTVRDKKVYAVLDARDEAHADKLGKTYLGASALMDLDYTDTSTMEKKGPTLLHVAVTNRPYVTGLDDFKELIAASADGSDEAVMLTAPEDEETIPMTKDEWIAAGAEFDIDVVALQAKADKADVAVALTNGLTERFKESGVLALSADDETPDAETLLGHVDETLKSNVALTNQVETLTEGAKKEKATARVESLIRQGRILPAYKVKQIELALSNEALFEALLPEKPIVPLSNATDDDGNLVALSNDAQASDDAISKQIEAITADAAAAGIGIK